MSLLLSAFSLDAQGYLDHLVDNIPSHSLMFVGGMADGASDVMRDKFSVSIDRFQNNPQWYDPRISWENKYEDWPIDTRAAYPGSKTWLAWTTDGWHLAKTTQLKSMQLAVVFYNPNKEKRKWWWPVADVAVSSLMFSAGWSLSNHFLVKPEYR